MIPHLQTIFAGQHPGVPGDCLRTAVASLLDLPTEQVPHFALFGDKWRRALSLWHRSQDKLLRVYTDDEDEAAAWAAAALTYANSYRPAGQLLIAVGHSSNLPDTAHAVLWRGSTLVHDVHPLQRGLASTPWLYLQVTDA